MPNPHNRKPVYFRSSTPNDINVTDIKKHIYQWEETGSLPAEVENGAAWMPPFENAGEIRVWADSNTLNYPAIPNAPMFWSTGTLTGAAKDEKILQIINNAAGRKDSLQFYDVDDAILWVSAQDDIYTNATPTTSIGEGVANITMEVRTSGSISLDSFYFQNGTAAGVLYGTHGGSPMNNPVGYLPTSGDLAPITYNNVPINPVNGGKIGCQLNFTNGSNGIGKYITYYVNGVQMPPFQGGPFYTSTSIAFNFAFAGGIQNSDDIVCIITDVPGFAPLVEGAPSKILYIDGANTVSAENYKWAQNPASNYPNSNGTYAIHTNVLSGNSANLTQLSMATPPLYGAGDIPAWRTFMQALPGKIVRIYSGGNSTTQWADVQINSIINDESD